MSELIRYRSDIDGLRAIAIIAVVLFHLNPVYLQGGFIGVDIFFVISGYLITKIIIREIKSGSFSYAKFYVRRIRRILPLLFTVLTFSLVIACLVLTTTDMVFYARTLQYAALQLSNILFQQEVGYFDPKFDDTPLLHTWSLGVEEQFYLIVPVMMVTLFKFKKHQHLPYVMLISLTLCSLIASQWLLNYHPKVAFYSLLSRFWELGLGGVIAFNKIQQPSRFLNEILGGIGTGIILVSFVFMNEQDFPGIKALAPCIGAGLIIFSGQRSSTLIHSLLSNKYLVFIGLISYSLYLWHWPIIVFYKFVTGEDISHITALLLFIILVVLSSISWKFIEEPFRKKRTLKYDMGSQDLLNNRGSERSLLGRWRRTDNSLILSTVVCMGLFYAVGANAINDKGWDWRLINVKTDMLDNAKELAALTSIQKLTHYEWCHIYREETYNDGERLPMDYRKCLIGPSKKVEVLLIGDSHAAHYSTAVVDWANHKGLSVLSMTAGACSSFGLYSGTRKKYCEDYATRVDSVWEEHKEDIKYIILAQKWMDYVYVGNNESIMRLKKILSVDAKVIILGQVPSMSLKDYDLKKPLIHKNFISGSRRVRIKEANDYLFGLAQEFDNVEFFDPTPHFCNGGNCFAVYQNNLLYMDDTHLNTFGSKYLASYFDF